MKEPKITKSKEGDYYSKREIDEILKKERVREVSLEGLITEISDFKGNDPHFILNVVYTAVLEDNRELLFITRAHINVDKEYYICDEHYIATRSDSILEDRKNHLRVVFRQSGKDYVKINVLETNKIIDTERDSRRMFILYGNYMEKKEQENKDERIILFGRVALAVSGVIGTGIIYATCFMPRTIEDARIVDIKREEVMNVKAGRISNWYKINVDKHDDCLITSEEIGAGLKVGDSLKEIKWRPQIRECDYMINYGR